MKTFGITGALIAGLIVSLNASASPDRPTFTKDILPIFQESCVACHRESGNNISGMVAPMSFMTYREVRPWAKAIARNVKARTMPPWFASDEFHGIFKNQRTISQEEIDIIVRWVETGAPRGNASDAPPPLKFKENGGWYAGMPDLIVTMPEPYFVPDDLDDQYVSFVTEPLTDAQLPRDRWLRSIEYRGDSDIVHHIVGATSLAPKDGEETQRFELGSIAPGEEATDYPVGYGKLLQKDSRIHFNMHYHKEAGPGTGQWDQSMVGFRFWDEEKDPPVLHPVSRNGISHHYFEIPPGHGDWEVGASKTFSVDTTILSLHPHMHLRGKDAYYEAIYPDGTRESLLDIPRFDFNWQLDYAFTEPKKVPAGTRVEFRATFDNSTDNPYNPDPSIPMGWGGPTTMEMMIGYIAYADTDPGEVPKEWKEIAND